MSLEDFSNWAILYSGIDISGGTGEPLPIAGATFEPIVKGLFSLEASALPVIALFCISITCFLVAKFTEHLDLNPYTQLEQIIMILLMKLAFSNLTTQST